MTLLALLLACLAQAEDPPAKHALETEQAETAEAQTETYAVQVSTEAALLGIDADALMALMAAAPPVPPPTPPLTDPPAATPPPTTPSED